MSTRNGKIARLPDEIREQVNLRLNAGQKGPVLLEWLNALPDVRQVLQAEFGGAPVTKQNLSEWRKGGFQEWLIHREVWAKLRRVGDFSAKARRDGHTAAADDVATFLAARFAALLSDWDGKVDAVFDAKTRALNRICRSVVQLQGSLHRARKENFDHACALEEGERQEDERAKQQNLNRISAVSRKPFLAEAFGGGIVGQKLASYYLAVENDQPIPDDKITWEDMKKDGYRRVKRDKAAPKRPAAAKKSDPVQPNPSPVVQGGPQENPA